MGDQRTHAATDARRAGDDFARAMASMTEVIEENEKLKVTIGEMRADHDAQISALTVERDRFERVATITQRDNETLGKQMKALRGERDHYFRCFTALKAGLGGVAAQILEHIKLADVHYYGERRQPRPAGEPELRGAPAVPRFLRPPDNELEQPERVAAAAQR